MRFDLVTPIAPDGMQHPFDRPAALHARAGAAPAGVLRLVLRAAAGWPVLGRPVTSAGWG